MSRALPRGPAPTRCTTPRRCLVLHAASASKDTTFAPLTTGLLALKEWAVACEALQNGDQTVILRKGGIREPTFTPAASHFYLFPTSFHVDSQLVRHEFQARYQQAMQFDPKQQATLRLTHYAHVTGAWRTSSSEVLAALSELHVWGEKFLEARLKWRAQQPLTVMELRMYCLPQPVELPLQEDYFGCFSWVDLAKAAVPALPLDTAQAVMSDKQFVEKQALLRAQVDNIQLQPLDAS